MTISIAEYEKNRSESAKKEQAYRDKLSKVPLRARILYVEGNRIQVSWDTENPCQLRPVQIRSRFFMHRNYVDADDCIPGVTGFLVPDGPADPRTNGLDGQKREVYRWKFIEDTSYQTYACGGWHIKRPETPTGEIEEISTSEDK